MGDIEIKEALSGDAEKILAYLKRIGGETDNLTFGADGFPITLEQEAAYLQQAHEDKHSIHLCAWRDGEIIADARLNGLPRRMNHRAEIGLTVVRAEWNKGIGSMLLEKLIEYARQNEIELVSLEVRSDNTRAIHVYEKYGFKRIGTFPAYFKIDGNYYDFELMYLDLR